MNKCYILFIIVFVFGSVSAFSIDTNLAKENYFSGETLQAEIFINGVLEEEISTGDIKLFCNNTLIGVSPSLLKLGTTHYYSFFWINKNLKSQQCEFKIKDVIYYDNGFLKQDSFSKNFSLIETNESLLFINPAGFKIDDIGSQNNLRVYLENLGRDITNISITTEDSFLELSISDVSGISESSSYFDIYLSEFLYNNEEKAEINLEYGTNNFIIPIWISSQDESNITPIEENITYVDESKIEFIMDVDKFNVSLGEKEDLSGYVTIKNVGLSLTNIIFSLTGNLAEVIDLQTETLSSFNSGDSFKEYLYVNQIKDAMPGNYEGVLKIDYESKSIEFPIFIEIKTEEIVLNGTGDVVDPGQPPKDEKSISIWWFVLIGLLILLGIVYFLYKKKTKINPDFLPRHV